MVFHLLFKKAILFVFLVLLLAITPTYNKLNFLKKTFRQNFKMLKIVIYVATLLLNSVYSSTNSFMRPEQIHISYGGK